MILIFYGDAIPKKLCCFILFTIIAKSISNDSFRINDYWEFHTIEIICWVTCTLFLFFFTATSVLVLLFVQKLRYRCITQEWSLTSLYSVWLLYRSASDLSESYRPGYKVIFFVRTSSSRFIFKHRSILPYDSADRHRASFVDDIIICWLHAAIPHTTWQQMLFGEEVNDATTILSKC